MVLKRLVPFDQRKFESASLDIADRLQNSYNAATGCLFHGTMKITYLLYNCYYILPLSMHLF